MRKLLREYSEIRKCQKKPDGIFTTFLARPLSPAFTWLAVRAGMSPDMVSLLSFIICTASCVFIFNAATGGSVAAGLLWWLGAVLDSSDGEVARYREMERPMGAWLDSFFDRLKEFMVFGTVSAVVFTQGGEMKFLLLGFLAVVSTVMSGIITDTGKIMTGERKPALPLGKNISFHMVDTRDFFVTVALFGGCLTQLLWLYGSLFPVLVLGQALVFIWRQKRAVTEKGPETGQR